MHAQDSLIHKRRHGHAGKRIGKQLSQLDTETTLALIKEAINAIDATNFMIAA